jgi:hypothetical protein
MIRVSKTAGAATFVLLGTIAFASVGCSKSPLYSELPRTPYGRYQALRGGEPPEKEPDSFGNMRPALRARLSPKDRP